MTRKSIASLCLLSLLVIGCAASDDRAAVARAVVNTGLAATAVALSAPMVIENCELQKSEYDRGACIRKNSEIKAAANDR